MRVRADSWKMACASWQTSLCGGRREYSADISLPMACFCFGCGVFSRQQLQHAEIVRSWRFKRVQPDDVAATRRPVCTYAAEKRTARPLCWRSSDDRFDQTGPREACADSFSALESRGNLLWADPHAVLGVFYLLLLVKTSTPWRVIRSVYLWRKTDKEELSKVRMYGYRRYFHTRWPRLVVAVRTCRKKLMGVTRPRQATGTCSGNWAMEDRARGCDRAKSVIHSEPLCRSIRNRMPSISRDFSSPLFNYSGHFSITPSLFTRRRGVPSSAY